MPSWGYLVVAFYAGTIAGGFVMALCAMAKCNDCRIIDRIMTGGKK